jgi:3-oxoacyl-[acyl-carrier protein] reductase
MDFSNKTAVVTGASRNIGQATAVTLAEHGANVGITARSNEDGCIETVERVENTGSTASFALGDLGDPDDISRVVSALRDDLGPIDILINNATIRPSKSFFDVESADIDTVQDVNFRGMFLMTQAAAKDMEKAGRGAIVNLLGTLVYLGTNNRSHSFGSKLAIEGLVRQLASELGPLGIRVNGVSPGLIKTERDTRPGWEDTKTQVEAATPLRRLGEVQEVADAICYMASDDASFITGQVLHVNGGLYPTPRIVT